MTLYSSNLVGELRINGKAELAIEVEAKAWIFSACAGASGSLHTSWCWAVRNQDGERQRSYEFEGRGAYSNSLW